jgi:hypothetical protein
MLQTVGYAAVVTGSITFGMWFKESEFRNLNAAACLIGSVGAILTMFFCLGITFGIPNFYFCLMTTTVTQTLFVSFVNLPI